MNFASEHRAVILIGGAVALFLLLLILIVLLRNKSRKGNSKRVSDFRAGIREDDMAGVIVNGEKWFPPSESADVNKIAAPPVSPAINPYMQSRSDEEEDEDEKHNEYIDEDFSKVASQKDYQPQFTELFVIEDPLEGIGHLGIQVNRVSSYISDFEIRAFINNYESDLLSQQSLQSGFAQKITVAGKIRTILFGEIEAISKSTATIHPEITDRIDRAIAASVDFRLLAIDGLVYGIFSIG